MKRADVAAHQKARKAEVDRRKQLSGAAQERIRDEMMYPYHGIMYEGKNDPGRRDYWARLRRSDVAALMRLAGLEVPVIIKQSNPK